VCEEVHDCSLQVKLIISCFWVVHDTFRPRQRGLSHKAPVSSALEVSSFHLASSSPQTRKLTLVLL
uniref:Uncharacterized protein n=1 Tax=Ciona savignyi TaxID=51511 RepID=H2YGZ0_CIOSA